MIRLIAKLISPALLLSAMLSFCAPRPLPGEQQRLLAFGAVLAEKNGMGYTQIFDRDEAFLENCRSALASSWKITDAASAKSVLDRLLREGVRVADEEHYNADELLLIANGAQAIDDETREHLNAVLKDCADCVNVLEQEYGYTPERLAAIKTTAALDLDRLVTLARWCCALEYLGEDAFWQYAQSAADLAAKEYQDWDDYFAAIALGRAITIGGDYLDRAVADKLLKSEDSAYKVYAFR